jgi:hypothetical protein
MKHVFILFLFLSFTSLVAQQTKESRYIYTEVDSPAFFPGGHEALNAYLSSFHKDLNTHFSPGTSLVVVLVIKEDGKVESVSTLGQELSQEVRELLERIFLSMPSWKPAVKQGKYVKSRLFLPLEF